MSWLHTEIGAYTCERCGARRLCVKGFPCPCAVRGTGRTSLQMKSAPKEALFIAIDCAYARPLAHHLGRPDLIFRPITTLDRVDNWRGYRFAALVLDHAVQAKMTPRQWDVAEQIERECVLRYDPAD